MNEPHTENHYIAFHSCTHGQSDIFLPSYQAELLLHQYSSATKARVVKNLLETGQAYQCRNTSALAPVKSNAILPTFRRRCAELYCSTRCRDLAYFQQGGHGLLCVEPSQLVSGAILDIEIDRALKMADFFAHAEQSREVFFCAAVVIAKILSIKDNNLSNSGTANEAYMSPTEANADSETSTAVDMSKWMNTMMSVFMECFPSKPRTTAVPKLSSHSISAATSPAASDEDMEELTEAQERVQTEEEESWILLYTAFAASPLVDPDALDLLLSREFYSTLVQRLEGHLHTVTLGQGPLVDHFTLYLPHRRLWSSGDSTGGSDGGSSGNNACNSLAEEEEYLKMFVNRIYGAGSSQAAQVYCDTLLLYSGLSTNTLPPPSPSALQGLPVTVNATHCGYKGRGTPQSSREMSRKKVCLFSAPGQATSVSVGGCVAMMLLPFTSSVSVHSCMPNIHYELSSSDSGSNEFSSTTIGQCEALTSAGGSATCEVTNREEGRPVLSFLQSAAKRSKGALYNSRQMCNQYATGFSWELLASLIPSCVPAVNLVALRQFTPRLNMHYTQYSDEASLKIHRLNSPKGLPYISKSSQGVCQDRIIPSAAIKMLVRISDQEEEVEEEEIAIEEGEGEDCDTELLQLSYVDHAQQLVAPPRALPVDALHREQQWRSRFRLPPCLPPPPPKSSSASCVDQQSRRGVLPLSTLHLRAVTTELC